MNVFTETLRRVASRVEGTRAISLVGADGIAVETWGAPEGLSIETVAAEMGGLLKAARSTNSASGQGEVREVATVTDAGITLLSRVTREYYLLLLLAREGNLGRGRFELRKAAAALEKELF
ncbi:MAG: roadblock/LC7 domain-containing protein [Acidobacteriota bacterium]|nr:roadblock/LC7 domain-containing protein [Acidobacteriota bacterium]